MFKKRIGRIFTGLLRIGLAVFFAASIVHSLLGIMQVRAAVKQVPLPTQVSIPMKSDWSTGCVAQKTVINGVGLGNANQLVNPQSVVLANMGELTGMWAQVAGIVTNQPLPKAVVFATNAAETVTVTDLMKDEAAYFFASSLPPASVITSTIINPITKHQTVVSLPPSPQNGLPSKGSGPRGLVIYSQAATSDLWYSAGRLTLASVSSQRDVVDSAKELLTITPLTAATDLIVTAVIIDNVPDNRTITVEAAAGGVFANVTEFGPSHGDILNITTLTLTAVPTGTSQLSLTVKSPPSPAGDSATLIGLNLNYRCETVAPPTNSPDLVINQGIISSPVIVNTPIKFSVEVTNTGFVTATNVMVTNVLQTSSNLSFSLPTLSCAVGSQSGTCYFEELAPGAVEELAFWYTPTATGVVTYVAIATSAQPDPTAPNIVTQTVEVVDGIHYLYLPLIVKPSSLAITITHSQNPAYNQIPYSYAISVTNTSNWKTPPLVIQDNLDARLLIEQVTPPAGCLGSTDRFDDFTISCDDGLDVGSTLTFSLKVRPQVTAPTTIWPSVNVVSLEPGFYFNYNKQVVPTRIDMCLHHGPGLNNAYSPLLLGETYCGQVQALKNAKYYFTFVLPVSGRVVATLRPASVQVPWIPPDIDYPASSQLAFTTTTGTSSPAWCCNVRTGTIVVTHSLDAGEHLLMIKSLETFGFAYTLHLEFKPVTGTAPLQKSQIIPIKPLSETFSRKNHISLGWNTAVFFVGFLSAVFSLVYSRKQTT